MSNDLDSLSEIATRLVETSADRFSSEAKKELKLFDTEAKTLQKAFIAVVKSKGDDVAAATSWFNGAIEENREMLEDGLDPGMRGSRVPTYKSANDALKDIRKLNYKMFSEDQAVSKEYESIEQVKKAGQAIATNPAKKIALLKKLGLSGEEFHALCIMIKDQKV